MLDFGYVEQDEVPVGMINMLSGIDVFNEQAGFLRDACSMTAAFVHFPVFIASTSSHGYRSSRSGMQRSCIAFRRGMTPLYNA